MFGLYGRTEYEGAVLQRVSDLKTFAPLGEGGVGGGAPTIVKGKLDSSDFSNWFTIIVGILSLRISYAKKVPSQSECEDRLFDLFNSFDNLQSA
jgi:hypothetical protein